MSPKYAVKREQEVRLFTLKDEKALDANINAGLIQNYDVIYELVPVGFVVSGVFNKHPDATSLVLAEWHGKRVVPEAPEKHEPIFKRQVG